MNPIENHIQVSDKSEPVAVMELYESGWDLVEGIDTDWLETLPLGTKLYTTPQQRTWVGLTDDERLEAAEIDGADEWFWKVCKAIEAKLKAKNGIKE